MNKCWAYELGDCRGKITQEHTISQGVFLEGAVKVQGFHWCKSEPKEIRRERLTRGILCDTHNNELSHVVDPAAVAAMGFFRGEIVLTKARAAIPPRRWTVERKKLGGYFLERWFLKTLINLSFNGPYKVGRESEQFGKPSLRLVRAAFGRDVLRARAGLYGLGHVGQNLEIGDGVRTMSLLDADGVLVGALFNLHGYRFAIWLEEEGLARVPALPPFPGENRTQQEAIHHLRAIRFMVLGNLSHVLQLQW